MVAKISLWVSRKWITKICYNLLQENREQTPPWVRTYIGDENKFAYFHMSNFKQLYLPQHSIAKIPTASPSCTDIAMSAVCRS